MIRNRDPLWPAVAVPLSYVVAGWLLIDGLAHLAGFAAGTVGCELFLRWRERGE